MRIKEACHARDHFDPVARELGLRDVDLGLDHVLDPKSEVRHGDLFFHPVVHAVNILVVVAGQVQHGLPDCLAGNRAGIDGSSADDLPLFDDRRAFAALGALNGGALSGGSRTDDKKVVGLHALNSVPI